jgi:uncharacterized Fe-S center protein
MKARYSTAAEGITAVTMPFGELVERKTATCGHCQKIVYVDAVGDGTGGASQTAVCHKCWSIVCAACHAKGICAPWQKQLEEIERKSDLSLRRYGISPAKQKGANA